MREYDVVRLDCDLPEEGLKKGVKGTIVTRLAPDSFLVEFSNEQGGTLALPALQRDQLTVVWRDESVPRESD